MQVPVRQTEKRAHSLKMRTFFIITSDPFTKAATVLLYIYKKMNPYNLSEDIG